MADGKGLKSLGGALGAEILRHRALDVLHGDGGAPAPERRRDRRQRARHEQVGLQPLDRRRPLCERHHDIGQDVERQRPDHAMHQGRQVCTQQRARSQRLDAERAVLQQQETRGAAFQKARHEQRIGPHGKADQHAGHGAARGALAPKEPAEEGRRQLRQRCERQQADRGELGVAERAIIQIRHHHDGEDRKAADAEQEVAEILAVVARRRAALQHQRQHDVVGDHDRERDAFHDHHRGCGRQAADENADAEQSRIRLDRQRQHIHVAVDGAERKGDEAGQRDRNHEQVDGDQIKRKQPARAADFLGAGILDHADVKLPRQQHDGAERQ